MSETLPLISVIVPVYNVEQSLHACINSIVSQTYKKLEIILVDDGSTDSSGDICDNFQKNDSRITVVHQRNKGLSQARNAGISVSTGSYLSFIDSDDLVSSIFIETLLTNLQEAKAQISICSIQKIRENGDIIDDPSCLPDMTLSSMKAIEQITEDKKNGWQLVPAWNKLYDRALFEHIRYPMGKLNEDEFVLYPLFFNANKITLSSKKMYYYTQRSTSIMNSSTPLRLLDGLEARYQQYKFCKAHDIPQCLSRIQELAKNKYYLVLMASRRATTSEEKKRVKQIKLLMNEIDAVPSRIHLLKDLLYYSLFNVRF